MVKNRYEKIAKKLSEKRRLLFHTSGSKKGHGEQGAASREEFWGPRGGLPLTCGVDPFPFPRAPRKYEGCTLDFQDFQDWTSSLDFKTGLLDWTF